MRTHKKFGVLGLLFLAFSLASCLGPGSPKAVVNDFTRACAEGDLSTADELLSETSWLFGMPCSLRRDADTDSLQAERVQGKSAAVIWEWRWTEPFRIERYQFDLSRGKKGWRIDGYQMTWEEYNTTSQATESIAAPAVVNQDPNLLEGIAYVQQSGIDGSRIVTRTARILNSEILNEAITGERILQEARSTIVVAGTRPRAQVLSELKELVAGYFGAYQAGDYQKLTALTYPEDIEGRDLQAVHRTAGLRITEFNVDEVKQLQSLEADTEGWWRSEPPRNTNLPGEPYIEPFVLEAEIPAFVRYQIFGVDMSSEATMMAIYRPDLGWKIHHWGPWAAAAPLESKSWDNAELRLDGVALYPNSTLVVATRVRPAKGDIQVSAVDDTGQGDRWGESMAYFPNTSTAYAWLDVLHPQAINVTVDLAMRPEGYFGESYEAQMVTPLTR